MGQKTLDAIKVIVFDFDGTLVDSNKIKYDAYFELCPRDERHVGMIETVLGEMLEESRFVILEEIIRRLEGAVPDMQVRVSQLAAKYNEIVMNGVKNCSEKAGTEKALKTLAPRHRLYVSSTTPEKALREILRYRNLDRYFSGIFGYPQKKNETLLEIMRNEQVCPEEVLVVGDGESDRIAAEIAGCGFVRVEPGCDLLDLVEVGCEA